MKLSIKKVNKIWLSLFLISSLFSLSLFANDQDEIKQIIAKDTAPLGIVFEIVGADGEYLTRSLQKVEVYRKKLLAKFPSLKIAVVSHGLEEFSLMTKNASQNKDAHNSVKRLVESDIPVHVCGNHARMRGVSAQEFPDYLQVAKRGPIKIEEYQKLGYSLIVID